MVVITGRCIDTRGLTWIDYQKIVPKEEPRLSYQHYILKMHVKAVKRAVDAIVETYAEFMKIDKEIKETPLPDVVMGGKTAQMKHDEIIKSLESRKPGIAAEAKKKIRIAQEDFIKDLNEQTIPTVESITGENAAAYQLISSGLLTTPSRLYETMKNYDSNPALRAAATQYAEKMATEADKQHDQSTADEWRSCRYIDSEKNLREFSNDFFELLWGTAETPYYYGMVFESPDGLMEMIKGYNLTAEYEAGE